MKPRKPKTEKQKLWAIADSTWRAVVKLRAKGKCEWCDKPGVDCHHMVSRRNYSLRCEPSNGVLLCKYCHLRFHNYDAEPGWTLFKKARPKDWKHVDSLRNATWKDSTETMQDIIAKLTDMQTALEKKLKKEIMERQNRSEAE